MQSKLRIDDMDLDQVHSGVRKPPEWMGSFLKHEYFSECSQHNHKSKNGERNLFCVNCEKGPFCDIDRRGEHLEHVIVQVRKASHTDAVRVSDLEKLGVSYDSIQTYSINGAKIVFLPSRPQAKPTKSAAGYCGVCNRSLQDPAKFCSLSCRELYSGKMEHLPKLRPGSPSTVLRIVPLAESPTESESEEGPSVPLRRNKRKATPHRAPFW